MSTNRCLCTGFEEEDCEGQDLLEAGRENNHPRRGQAQYAGKTTQCAHGVLSCCPMSLHIKGIRIGCRFSKQRYLFLAAPILSPKQLNWNLEQWQTNYYHFGSGVSSSHSEFAIAPCCWSLVPSCPPNDLSLNCSNGLT